MLSLKSVLIFCFTEDMIQKVQQINDCRSKSPSLSTMVICHLVLIEDVLSVTNFHNGYNILVYVID